MASYIEDINKEAFILFKKEWKFIEKDWPVNQEKYNHVSELKLVKNIEDIKIELKNKLGVIPVYYFLTELYTAKEYMGPYNEIEKGLLLLHQLVSGKPGSKINNIPISTYSKLYKQFWIKQEQFDRINKKVNKNLKEMFSSPRSRVLSALDKNPPHFKHITMMLDGHDGRIQYYNPYESKKDLYSYKFKKSGVRTQVVIDINDMVTFVSDSEKCSENNDGSMFVKMKLEAYMNTADCIAVDGGYTLFIPAFIEKTVSISKNITKNNFSYPVRKLPGEDLTEAEIEYNEIFGSFRSKVEHKFGDLGKYFQRFNNCRSLPYMTDIKVYNLQFKVACLLLNMKIFCEKHTIIPHNYHNLWLTEGFDFPKKEKPINYMLTNNSEIIAQRERMQEIQQQLLNISLGDTVIEDEMLEDESENDYEISSILQHKYKKNNIYYLVKFTGYSNKDNQWIKSTDLSAEELINQYWESQQQFE